MGASAAAARCRYGGPHGTGGAGCGDGALAIANRQPAGAAGKPNSAGAAGAAGKIYHRQLH